MFPFQIVTSATTVFPSQVTFWTDGSEDDNMSFGGGSLNPQQNVGQCPAGAGGAGSSLGKGDGPGRMWA